MKIKQELYFRNLEYVKPPGTMTELLSHPIRDYGVIEVAVFNEHRYAFFFWNKWTNKLIEDDSINHAPCLVTLDWHTDLGWPTEGERKWLDKLDSSNNLDTSLYAWANLSGLNDDHIVAAAYLNKIGNIYVHCRQGRFGDDEDKVYTDKFGNKHLIKKFKVFAELELHLLQSDEQCVYFDIDLDFFTLNNPLNGKGKEFTYLTDSEIKRMLPKMVGKNL